MTLQITFNEDAFHQEEPKNINHNPEYKKFNMRFHNMDLLIIDAIAKRDGTSRSQILNLLIDRVLKGFLEECNRLEAYAIMKHADDICVESKKSDLDFSWESWYERKFYPRNPNDFYQEFELAFNVAMEQNTASEPLKSLIHVLEKAKK
ncbi:hypothetical protein [Psychrobacter sanguinis]|uniref:hypothetical protein n=1 Tax=Psychrobacter sanguinis TaxID=861445 RepID=UPI002A757A7C|nr:hypothetical protein [Psychrobacter sanguinis]MDY3306752.1 hypothetical protein [Psychrobacter sanguinis]